MSRGYVYILSNKFLRGPEGAPLLKIGGTARSAHHRRQELSAQTGVPGTFEIEAEIEVANWQQLERLTHNELSAFWRAGEFFEIDVGTALSAINEINGRLKARKLAYASQEYTWIKSKEPVPASGCVFRRYNENLTDFYFNGALLGQLTTHGFFSVHDPGSPGQLFSDSFDIILIDKWRGSDKWSEDTFWRTACSKIVPFAPVIAWFLYPRLAVLPESANSYIIQSDGIPIIRCVLRRTMTGFFRKKELIETDCIFLDGADDFFLSLCSQGVTFSVKPSRNIVQKPGYNPRPKSDRIEDVVLMDATSFVQSGLFISGTFRMKDELCFQNWGRRLAYTKTFGAIPDPDDLP